MSKQKFNGLSGLLKLKPKYSKNGKLKNNKEESKNWDKKILKKTMKQNNKIRKGKKNRKERLLTNIRNKLTLAASFLNIVMDWFNKKNSSNKNQKPNNLKTYRLC